MDKDYVKLKAYLLLALIIYVSFFVLIFILALNDVMFNKMISIMLTILFMVIGYILLLGIIFIYLININKENIIKISGIIGFLSYWWFLINFIWFCTDNSCLFEKFFSYLLTPLDMIIIFIPFIKNISILLIIINFISTSGIFYLLIGLTVGYIIKRYFYK